MPKCVSLVNQDLLSGLAAVGQRSARAQGLTGSRSNPNLFERDEGDDSVDAKNSLFEHGNAEAVRVQRLSVSGALGDARKDAGDLVDPLGVDIDALAAAAAAAETVTPAKKELPPVRSTPQKASGAANAVDGGVDSDVAFICPRCLCTALRLIALVSGRKKSAGSLFQDVDDSSF